MLDPDGYWCFNDALTATTFADSSGNNRPAGWLGSYALGQNNVVGDAGDLVRLSGRRRKYCRG